MGRPSRSGPPRRSGPPDRGDSPGRGAPKDRGDSSKQESDAGRSQRPPRDGDSRRRDGSGRGRPPSSGSGRPPRNTGSRGGRGRGRGPEAGPALTLAAGSEVLYGRNAVAEALFGRRHPRRLFVAEGVKEDDRIRAIVKRAEERHVTIDRPPRMMLDDLLSNANHQGIALETTGYPYMEFEDLLAADGTVLVLDHLQDPQNFGTLLRTAEAAGVAGVVMPQNRSAEVTPAVVNASAGAVEHLRIAQVPNLARALETLKGAGRWIVGLDSGPGSTELYQTDVPQPAALVVGAEGSGIGHNVRNHCDLIVSLPMRGRIASLNAASAGAIALYELLRSANDREDDRSGDS